MTRLLYLVAYDVRNPKRLRLVHRVLKDFACGGQKSAFECYLTQAEHDELTTRVEECMDTDEDALLVIRLTDRDSVSTMGIAVKPADELYTYLG
ncbi:CRISPR-associated endonuclease Cas2 [Marinimicrobium sp. ARAG 43.8]|uniref:CRISPR-associated endonuclease Cas2 n=1 Tax=Marinimicrobium sp. ARAG 43.8 TaxID=3418719 RepID=UPI003CF4D4C1